MRDDQPANWRKARRSKAYGDCVEAASYRKSSFSAELDCVEAACGPGVVGVRDSRLRGGGPVLEFPAAAWRAFTRRVSSP